MKRILVLFSAVICTIAALAQRPVVADKIVGIVGDKIILKSDITNAILDAKRQGQEIPPDAECFIIQQALAQKALVLQAEKDSIVVSEEEIEALLDNQIRGFIQAYGTKEALEQIAGRTIYQLKEDFRQPFRERKLAEAMRNKVVESVKITPNEVKAYFDKIPKDSLPFYESELELGEIVVFPKASRDIEKLAIDQLNDFKKQVESGSRRFEALASLYSDDPGSKDRGGEYAINRNEKQWDPTFLAAAFRLKEGQISPVIKTKFGYHIIKMESRAGDDATIRHILKIPQVTQDEIDEAIKRLDSVRAKLIAGTMNFGEAVAKYSDDETAKFTGGLRQCRNGNYCTIDELDKDVVMLLQNMKVGEYSQPTAFTDERGRKGVRIAYLKTRTEPHRENLKDDYNRIAQRAIEIKKEEAIEKWFKKQIPTYYIMIDQDYRTCTMLGSWLTVAKTN
ncbi:MAG TPA: peptidylprolyl isomerase [Chitinophagaceae bacterium]|nr:peptidylprolyl isomerase [Chitinophagaceae bacterium]